MHDRVKNLRKILKESIDSTADRASFFFKTGVGEYAQHDQFMGISVPVLRKIAKEFLVLTLDELATMISSPFNEERLLVLIILTQKYEKATEPTKASLYQFYMQHLPYVNNWNLVDASSHRIIGAHLWDKDKSCLITLAHSDSLWERRIAMVATWYFIRNNDLEWTFKIAVLLQQDRHDLIHKAVGWMLREAGKKDQAQLMCFLEAYAYHMPRTMLRYAIEKFTPSQRSIYLHKP